MNLMEKTNFYEKKVDDFLKEYFEDISRSTTDCNVLNAVKYSVFSGGKRLRPILVLEFCNMCYGDYQLAKEFSLAVEMVHTYSLIHDDLPCMDDDDTRRDKPSCHIAFGEDIALLAGDALLSHAFHSMSLSKVNPKNVLRAMKLLSGNIGISGMVGGQALDITGIKNGCSDIDLIEIHRLKTAKLIQASCALGVLACAGEVDESVYQSALRYGNNLGLAFQLIDDILDFENDLTDLESDHAADSFDEKMNAVFLYGIDECHKKAEAYTEAAKSELKTFNNNGYILQLTNLLLKRDK